MCIKNALSKNEFEILMSKQADAVEYQGRQYFDDQSNRLYWVYFQCCKFLCPGQSLLSVGAGSGYVESALAAYHNVKVSVLDFPEMLEKNKAHYARCGFNCVAANVMESDVGIFNEAFDLLLSAEIIEHLPEAPSKHVAKFVGAIKRGGYMMIATPNLASLSTLVAITRMRPILPPSERTFGPASFENEGVHRREYMPSEIKTAMEQNGLTHIFTQFVNKQIKGSFARRIIYNCFCIIPRFRSNFIIVGKK